MSSKNRLLSISCLDCLQRQRLAWQFLLWPLFLLLAALGNMAAAGTFTAYGPETFVRTAGAPNSYEASFSVLNPNTGYTLNIYNGGLPQSGTASNSVQAAQVYLNGQIVANSNVFKNKKSPLITIPVTVQENNQLTVVLEGKPGGQLTLELIGVDNDPPVITATGAPEPNPAGWNNSNVTVSFDCSDAISGIATCSDPVSVDAEGANQTVTGTATDNAGNSATASLDLSIDKTPPAISSSLSPPPNVAGWHNADVTVSFIATDAVSGIAEVTEPVLLATEGAGQEVTGMATDVAGNSATSTATVNLDKTPPQVAITNPADGTVTIAESIEVAGTVTDNNTVADVSVNGIPATLSGSDFSATISLAEGANAITVTATDIADNQASASVSITRVIQLGVQITHPATLITVGSTPLEVRGTINDQSASLTVNGAPVDNANGLFAAQVNLEEGLNTIVARAVNARDEVTDSIVVSLDMTPPYVTIESPVDGDEVSSDRIAVTGLINDIVRGTISADEAVVTVNGIPATVSNRTYLAQDVPLKEGTNLIEVLASDQVGNTGRAEATVTYLPPAGPQIGLISGQGQQARILTELPEPLVVRLVDGAGVPVAGENVVFRVIQGDGFVGAGTPDASQAAAVVTDAGGVASTSFLLGSRAGNGNHRVRATAVAFEGEVIFHASAEANPGDKVSTIAGDNQRGGINQPLPQPLIVAVTDVGSNLIPNAEVEFEVTDGSGVFQNGEIIYGTTTDTDGRASAELTLGPEEGLGAQRVAAKLLGTEAFAGFTASAFVPGDPGQTSISGVVLDNQDNPVPGVTLRVDGTTRQAVADTAGQFTITDVPVGPVHLLADGSTATVPGEWPTLSYNLVTVAGVDNPLHSPIYLVKLDTDNAKLVGATDADFTLPEIPGFKLTVKAGSVTFPDGSNEGLLSVTPVNANKVPMPPPNGMQPQFIVTIQPAGAMFDPPAPLTLPNVDGHAPGAQVEMYSYDHDLEEFVTIGLGTVSADGTVISSNPGVGVIKAGWHCGSQPGGSGCAHSCTSCTTCEEPDCICNIVSNPDCNIPCGDGFCGYCEVCDPATNTCEPSKDPKDPTKKCISPDPGDGTCDEPCGTCLICENTNCIADPTCTDDGSSCNGQCGECEVCRNDECVPDLRCWSDQHPCDECPTQFSCVSCENDICIFNGCSACQGATCAGCQGDNCSTCSGVGCDGCSGPDCQTCSGVDCQSDCEGQDCDFDGNGVRDGDDEFPDDETKCGDRNGDGCDDCGSEPCDGCGVLGGTCEDGNACTADLCQEGICISEPTPGAICDDSDECTIDDICNGDLCQGRPKAPELEQKANQLKQSRGALRTRAVELTLEFVPLARSTIANAKGVIDEGLKAINAVKDLVVDVPACTTIVGCLLVVEDLWTFHNSFKGFLDNLIRTRSDVTDAITNLQQAKLAWEIANKQYLEERAIRTELASCKSDPNNQQELQILDSLIAEANKNISEINSVINELDQVLGELNQVQADLEDQLEQLRQVIECKTVTGVTCGGLPDNVRLVCDDFSAELSCDPSGTNCTETVLCLDGGQQEVCLDPAPMFSDSPQCQ